MTIIEAHATGLPAIAVRPERGTTLVRNRETGLLFEPGSVADLARKIEPTWAHEKEAVAMSENARKTFEDRFTPERNYEMLMAIYEQAKERRRQKERERHG